MARKRKIPKKILDALQDPQAIFYCSHSGGKDSQAMHDYLVNLVPDDRLVVVHADLGEIEYEGTQDHIRANIHGKELNVVRAGKTLFDMVEKRGMWPSAQHRQCTSDLKTGPIMKFIRQDVKAKGAKIAVNCMGIRAEESDARAKKEPFKINAKNTVNKRVQRTVYDWMPIFDWTVDEVYDRIYEIGQKPYWIYGERGELNDRMSCVFCIMGSDNDLRLGAQRRPELYEKYVRLERKVGHTIFMKGKKQLPLDEKVGIPVLNID